MIRFLGLFLIISTLVCSCDGCPVFSGNRNPEATRLVTLVVVSGVRGDEIVRFEKLWRHGFKRLLEQGRYYSKAIHRRGRTDSASGRATLGTGVSPKHHGVINDFMFYSPQNRLLEVCGKWKPFCGAALLQHPSLAQRIKQESESSKVVILGATRHFTALLGGDHADLALWFSRREFELKSVINGSEAKTPSWLERYFESMGAPDRISRVWELGSIPKPFANWEDSRKGEYNWGRATSFPHKIEEDDRLELWQAWQRTPDADRAIGDLGSYLVSKMKLGQDDDIDYLVIGFSAVGQIGTDFGPYSLERVSALMELDRVLGDFLEGLDEATGKKVVLGLSAEHGVAPLAEEALKRNKKGQRIVFRDVVDEISDKMLQRFGSTEVIELNNFPFLSVKSLPSVNKAEVVGAAVNALNSHPAIYRAWPVGRLAEDEDPIAGAMAESVMPGKSGDIAVVLRPYHTVRDATSRVGGTRSGSPWHYDRHVPLFLWGNNIGQRRLDHEVSVVDLLRTLGDELGLDADALGGSPLP